MKMSIEGKRVLVGLLVGLFLLFMGSGLCKAEDYVLSIGDYTVELGEEFKISIKINTTTGLDSWSMILLYDPQILEYVNSYYAKELTIDYDLPVEAYEPIRGEINLSGAVISPQPGSGPFLALRFKAKNKVGCSALNLEFVDDLNNPLAGATAENGKVCVKRPEPAQTSEFGMMTTFTPFAYTYISVGSSVAPSIYSNYTSSQIFSSFPVYNFIFYPIIQNYFQLESYSSFFQNNLWYQSPFGGGNNWFGGNGWYGGAYWY